MEPTTLPPAPVASPPPAPTPMPIAATPLPAPVLTSPPPVPAPSLAPQQPVVDLTEVYAIMCAQIVKEQTLIMGALALEQARHVTGLTVDPATYSCRVSGDGTVVIEALINQYRDFFGNAAVEVCKEAASRFMTRLPVEKVPLSLRAK